MCVSAVPCATINRETWSDPEGKQPQRWTCVPRCGWRDATLISIPSLKSYKPPLSTILFLSILRLFFVISCFYVEILCAKSLRPMRFIIHLTLLILDPFIKLPPYGLERLLAVSRRYGLAEWKHFRPARWNGNLPQRTPKTAPSTACPSLNTPWTSSTACPQTVALIIFSVKGIKGHQTHPTHAP